jgi:uncharacterized protein
MSKACLIIFTRYPEAGKVKTRLIPALGAAGAAKLHQQMAENTLIQARLVPQIAIEVWFVGGNTALMQDWLGADLIFQAQPEGDLGDRMCRAFESVFSRGYTKAAIVGTDCPALTQTILEQSFSDLEQHILSIGPATDGGYYLIGLQHSIPELFANITWSTSSVLTQTLTIAAALKLTPSLLPYLHDIDLPADLKHLPIR